MMISIIYKIKKYYLIFIFLCAIFSTKGQNIYNKADSLYKNGDYFRSAIEYERIVFEQKDASIQRHALLQKALSLKHQERYSDAIDELNRIAIRNPQDSLFTTKSYHLAVCYYLNKEYRECIDAITMVQPYIINSSILPDLLLLKTLSHNQLFQHEKAKKTLQTLEQQTNNEALYKQIVNDLYINNKPKKFKDPDIAHRLAMFIPRSGHIYSGAIGEGIINFLLNASALGFGAWHTYTGYYFTAYVVGVTSLERFYTGGKRRAENLAEWKNTENANKLNLQILSYFESEISKYQQ